MGRAAVLVLALANLGYLAWSAGALAIFDLAPAHRAATEPHRLAGQILPERLRIVTPEQERQEARARQEALEAAEARARIQAQGRELGTSASATVAGSDAVLAVSEPTFLSVAPVAPTPPEPSDRPVPAAAASAAGASRPAAAPR